VRKILRPLSTSYFSDMFRKFAHNTDAEHLDQAAFWAGFHKPTALITTTRANANFKWVELLLVLLILSVVNFPAESPA
jgi:hypothetical protein